MISPVLRGMASRQIWTRPGRRLVVPSKTESVRPRSLAASVPSSRKEPPREDALQVNDAVVEVIALSRGEEMKINVSVQTKLAEGLPLIQGDRFQLQQVILNLIINVVKR